MIPISVCIMVHFQQKPQGICGTTERRATVYGVCRPIYMHIAKSVNDTLDKKAVLTYETKQDIKHKIKLQGTAKKYPPKIFLHFSQQSLGILK